MGSQDSPRYYRYYFIKKMNLDLENKSIYIAKSEYLDQLKEELNGGEVFHDIIIAENRENICFAMDIWFEPKLIKYNSISEAVKILKAAGRFWYHHPVNNIRRAALIQEQLRKLPVLASNFPLESDVPHIGGFCLLDQNTLIYSVERWKPWPEGKCYFNEDKVGPPNRAYLKLWEALTLLGKLPQPGAQVLDLGASPGGWTYVMQALGAQVTAVDRAELDPRIQELPHVAFIKQSAFSLDPNTVAECFDFVLCDVICYPEKTYQLAKQWIDSGKARQIIFTIKLQGKTNLESLIPFKSLPHSEIFQLFYNKHEVTFFHPKITYARREK
jgi:23S rRNA (cytidine2498-2'-O)-methyltransferase